jgi:hypothetical protein
MSEIRGLNLLFLFDLLTLMACICSKSIKSEPVVECMFTF